MDKALNMKWKFMECWGDVEKSNMLIYVANILDPRSRTDLMENYFMNMYKHEYTDDGEKLWKKKAEFVIAAIYELFNEYVGMAGGSQQKANFQSSGYKQYLYEDTSHLGLFMKHEVGFGGNVDCKTEIDIYLNEDSIEDFAGFDILLWWKYNSARYPILSKMAKDVLAIPVLVTPPESAYSTSGGNLLDDFRSSSSPSKVEALVCTQDWISKSSKKTNVVKGSIDLDKFVKGMCKHMKGTTV
uniref:zinc finger BED domain-containing protein RICESLEEPER 1-like n=1 Tax=Erigeron canadensis TaxID=72917 RepID=UPI001CB97639|nr:zinc finger BED domain-containing protein RICESLEEPER 1-like [Erigeron canadensis]